MSTDSTIALARRRFFSTVEPDDKAGYANPKAEKALDYGCLNAIQYMAPSDMSGTNLCSHASAGCIALCLGWFSGQASYVSDLDLDSNNVRESRIARARAFMHDRPAFMSILVDQINALVRRAAVLGLQLVIRLNGSTDIAWEGIRNPEGKNVFELFPDIQFVDYTKNHGRFNRVLPPNYCLTFSRSETNEAKAVELLGRGVNVAVVFAGDKPASWHGFDVIDGDAHDLRHLDPKGARGVVVALSPKGPRARRDQSGFVVRDAA